MLVVSGNFRSIGYLKTRIWALGISRIKQSCILYFIFIFFNLGLVENLESENILVAFITSNDIYLYLFLFYEVNNI